MNCELNLLHAECPFDALPDDVWIVCTDNKNVIMNQAGTALPKASMLRNCLDAESTLILGGTYEGASFWGIAVASLAKMDLPESVRVMEGRAAFLQPTCHIMNMISRCREFALWRKAHRYCGGCQAPLTFAENDLALVCPECGMRYYPQIAPAIIVAITRNNGQELLMAHNKRFTGNTYSLIAGFVEAGETVEQAVHREVLEETGVRVKNVRYLSSQPWPFPNSLMLGMVAEYESGTPFPCDGELTDIQWYTKDHLPQIPSPGSIAHSIIKSIFN